MSLLLPAHSFHIPCGSPLLAWSARSPSRSSCRGSLRHSSVPPLVPCGVLLVPVSRLACPLSASLACLPRVPHRHGSLVSPTAPCSLSPRPSPRRSCRKTGRHRLACLPLSCGEVLLRSASLPLSCGVSLLAWLGAVLAYLNAFLGNFLKTCLGNLLKTCLGNSLNTAKHIPISICPLSAFLRFYRSASPPAVSLFSLSFAI